MNAPSNDKASTGEPIRASIPNTLCSWERENHRTELSFGPDDEKLAGEPPQSVLDFPEFGKDRADINMTLAEVINGTAEDFRVFDVIAELLVGYDEFPDSVNDKWWSFLNFGLTDPFQSDMAYSSEIIALAHHPKAKVIKARVFFTFMERSHFGRYCLDQFSNEELLKWANFKLDEAIQSHRRIDRLKGYRPKWHIYRGRVSSIEVEPNKMAHRAYLKAREAELVSEVND